METNNNTATGTVYLIETREAFEVFPENWLRLLCLFNGSVIAGELGYIMDGAIHIESLKMEAAAASRVAATPKRPCGRCGGSGIKSWVSRSGYQQSGTCFRCHGSGEWTPAMSNENFREVRKFHGDVEAALLARGEAYND